MSKELSQEGEQGDAEGVEDQGDAHWLLEDARVEVIAAVVIILHSRAQNNAAAANREARADAVLLLERRLANAGKRRDQMEAAFKESEGG